MSNEDEQHLDLLAIFHYVVGGVTALFGCFPVIYLLFGLALLTGTFPDSPDSQGEEVIIGWVFVGIALVFISIGWGTALCIIIAGRKLKRHEGRTFCMVIAGIECMFMPFGTILGVFTLVVLSRESVKELFDKTDSNTLKQFD